MFMSMYASSRVKKRGFYGKSELQMFLIFDTVHGTVHQLWRLHTKLYKEA